MTAGVGAGGAGAPASEPGVEGCCTAPPTDVIDNVAITIAAEHITPPNSLFMDMTLDYSSKRIGVANGVATTRAVPSTLSGRGGNGRAAGPTTARPLAFASNSDA